MKTQTPATQLKSTLTLALLALGGWPAAFGQAPVIASFSQNGELVCTNLEPGSVATVEWAPAVTGPWTNNWAGLDGVAVDSNGMIRVSVPMFYRVRGGIPAGTNGTPPAGMALIPAGSFTMGDTFNDWPPEWGPNPEIPAHTVYVSAFYMDKYEVTKALWDEVYNWATNRPVDVRYSFSFSGLGKAANHPVHTINWYDAVKWCNARSEKEGRVPAYYTSAAQTTVYRTGQVDLQNDWVKWSVGGYRLPTEAEWEKAARGGATGRRFPWSDTDTITHGRANYYAYPPSAGGTWQPFDVNPTDGTHPTFANGVEYTSPVDFFTADGYGLHDMAGNVLEWCWDWYFSTYYSSSPGTDPRGPPSGSSRVERGGSWESYAGYCRTAVRDNGFPTYRFYFLGFRCALPPGP